MATKCEGGGNKSPARKKLAHHFVRIFGAHVAVVRIAGERRRDGRASSRAEHLLVLLLLLLLLIHRLDMF